MSITFLGEEIPETERIITGFHSLDKALGNKKKDVIGFPIKTMVEIYGAAGVGKTTIMLSLAGIFAKELGGKIVFADLEGQSKDTITNSLEMGGFSGELDMLRDEDTLEHYQMLDNMIERFKTDDYNVAILDSIGAFMSPGEQEGSVADANMGKKPFIIGNWTRKVIDVLIRKRGICMYTSHQHSNIGFVGTHTSGGETKKFLNAVQLEVKRKDDYETGWVLEGRVKKNRYGQVDQYFRVFCIGGQGIHQGLSAVFDCVSAGLATIERNVVKTEDHSFGKVGRMIETWQDESQFAPFINMLKAQEIPVEEPEESEPEESKPKKKKGRGH